MAYDRKNNWRNADVQTEGGRYLQSRRREKKKKNGKKEQKRKKKKKKKKKNIKNIKIKRKIQKKKKKKKRNTHTTTPKKTPAKRLKQTTKTRPRKLCSWALRMNHAVTRPVCPIGDVGRPSSRSFGGIGPKRVGRGTRVQCQVPIEAGMGT